LRDKHGESDKEKLSLLIKRYCSTHELFKEIDDSMIETQINRDEFDLLVLGAFERETTSVA